MDGELDSTLPEIVEFIRKRDYVRIRGLGQGACGITVLLHDKEIDEYFVCKEYSPTVESRRKELFQNFIREIKLLHKVHHPNIVRVFNHYLYQDDCRGFLLMEFVDGDTVDKYLGKHRDKINDVFIQTLNGFAHLEQAGILHRDICKRNLLVTNDGRVKIIDLGFGKHVIGTTDFDKSISLNWGCETPKEFKSDKYDFATEVYFVGKLFENLIDEIGIENFNHGEVLGKMCQYDPESRYPSFSATVREVRNECFSTTEFTKNELLTYRTFATSVFRSLERIFSNTEYHDDFDAIIRRLEVAYSKVCLEEWFCNSELVTECLLAGRHFTTKAGFETQVLSDFIDLCRRSTLEKRQMLFANLQTRMDGITRYYSDAPF